MNTLFCFGFGYVAAYLTHALQTQNPNWRVKGTTQSSTKKEHLKSLGIEAFKFHQFKPIIDPVYCLGDVTHLLISIPPGDLGDLVLGHHEKDILNEMPNLKWVGYLSSTSVYGDKKGAWVDETAEKEPTSKRGSRRAKAEEQWLMLKRKNDLPVHVFRLSGIYGPGRSAIESIRAGTARRIDKPGHAFSRIHVDDIIQTLMTSMQNSQPGAIYNLSDDEPSPSHEVIAYACQLLGKEIPPLIPFEEANVVPMVNSFYKDNKRIINDKIKEELGVKLSYPNFKLGLQACLEDEPLELAKTF